MFQREKLNFKVIIRFPIKNEKFSVMNLIHKIKNVVPMSFIILRFEGDLEVNSGVISVI